MGGYPLGPLLSAREYREDAAKREAAAALAAAREAREAADAAKARWRHYREWRPGEEARLFEEIRGGDWPVSTVDAYRESVHALRETELALERAGEEADRAAVEAESAAEQARRRHVEAVRNRQKIQEHKTRWLRAEALRQEAAAEAEMEDFSAQLSEEDSGGDGAF